MSTKAQIAAVLRKGREVWLDPEDALEMAADLLAAGYAKPVEQEEMTVYGYAVVMRDGTPVEDFGLLTQQDAIDRATSMTRDAAESGIDWDYRIAAIVDQGGL